MCGRLPSATVETPTKQQASETMMNSQHSSQGHSQTRPAAREERSQEHGSPELALAVYLFLAAFAYVFAVLSGTV